MNKLIHFLKGPKILIVTTSILIVGSIVLFGFNDDPTSAFQTVPVKIGTVSQEITVTGKIKSAEAVDLAFERSGKVVWVNAKIGQKIKTGQIFAQIDASEAQRTLRDTELILES